MYKFADVPVSQRLEALQTAVILLPEENQEVLHCLLLFLGDIAEHADEHQVFALSLRLQRNTELCPMKKYEVIVG